MKSLRTEYVIYKQTSLNMYPMEVYEEEFYDEALLRLDEIRKRYPQCTYVLVKRIVSEESLEI